MRERLIKWGKLLLFREYCFSLVELADMVRDKRATDEANRKLAIEAARVERERFEIITSSSSFVCVCEITICNEHDLFELILFEIIHKLF